MYDLLLAVRSIAWRYPPCGEEVALLGVVYLRRLFRLRRDGHCAGSTRQSNGRGMVIANVAITVANCSKHIYFRFH